MWETGDGMIKLFQVKYNDIRKRFLKLVYLIFVFIARKYNEKIRICASGRRIAARSEVRNII